MVPKKRQAYEVDFFRAPVIPRAPRSIRKRTPIRNSIEDSKLCAFELLAAVAGKLLQESESSASSNAGNGKNKHDVSGGGIGKVQQPIDVKALKSESFDHGSCAESACVPKISIQEQNHLSKSMGPSKSENGSILEHTSKPGICDVSEKVLCGKQHGVCGFKNANGNPICNVGGSVCYCKVENEQKMHMGDDKCQVGELSMAKASNVNEPNEKCRNSSTLINSGGSVQLPMYREPIADAFLQKHWSGVNLGIRDDDENSYGCKKINTRVGAFKPQQRMHHRRIRKMLASKYRKVAPKLKGYELYNTGKGMKSFYQYRKRIYTQEMSQQAPIRKRKLSDQRFSVAYDQDTSSNSITNLPEKGSRAASEAMKTHKRAKDTHVKFSIKDFKVPEIFIEVPETASVGFLKRSVMEAVTAILGSGITVGVVLQGNKVRDDNRTLQQAGISQTSNLDNLGFTLEPFFTQLSPSKTPKKPSSVSPCVENQELPRSPVTPTIDSNISNPPQLSKLDDNVDAGPLPSPQTPKNEPTDGPSVPVSNNALVEVPTLNVEPLAVVPVNPKRSELSQRRTRRPFSVTEVEALVGSVEKLGTGRWRDVKVGAFENADHRTYVDLKDKWKTLVHTAQISPHQRRGQPVPQELLDRVLSAHSYWTQHQLKQHGKHNPIEALKTGDGEIVGA